MLFHRWCPGYRVTADRLPWILLVAAALLAWYDVLFVMFRVISSLVPGLPGYGQPLALDSPGRCRAFGLCGSALCDVVLHSIVGN